MPLPHEFIEESGYLHCKISGPYSGAREAIEFFGQVILRSRCSGLTNILYDTRDMTDYPGATEKIIYMSRIIDQHDNYIAFGGKPLRVAFLGNKEENPVYSPGLEVAASREFAALSTSDLKEALAWFLEPDTKANSNWKKSKAHRGIGLGKRV